MFFPSPNPYLGRPFPCLQYYVFMNDIFLSSPRRLYPIVISTWMAKGTEINNMLKFELIKLTVFSQSQVPSFVFPSTHWRVQARIWQSFLSPHSMPHPQFQSVTRLIQFYLLKFHESVRLSLSSLPLPHSGSEVLGHRLLCYSPTTRAESLRMFKSPFRVRHLVQGFPRHLGHLHPTWSAWDWVPATTPSPAFC